ncbi:MAG: dephospho-CoA kinase [Sphingomicrobium sp.]
MIQIGLTGSIGMGKSTVARMFAAAGIPVFDADAEVRRMNAGPLAATIGAAFPKAVRNGQIDRDALAGIVLADPAKLARIEAIIHPAVAAARADFIARHEAESAVLFDIPLLFEIHSEDSYDKVIVVTTSATIQRERVLRRPGMTKGKLESILTRQLPDSDKQQRADFVIDTSGELAATEAQVRDIIACLGLPERD